MPAQDAFSLVNWVAQQYGVRTRKGYKEWAVGIPDPVQTLMSYQSPTSIGTSKLFAVTDNEIYNVTVEGAAPVPELTLPGGQDYGRFSSTMFENTAGLFLLVTSESGGYAIYDGANWTVPVEGTNPGEIKNVDPAKFTHVCSWKRRVWCVEQNTSRVWYGPTDQITGEFKQFDLGPFMVHGGDLKFVATWTIDAGEGIDDFIVFAGSRGDILIYKGVDPDNATDFQMVGKWYIGSLVRGKRGYATMGGDLLILSEHGLQPMSYVTRGGQTVYRTSAADYLSKIQPRISQLVSQLGREFGWELQPYPRENYFIVQKPRGSISIYDQYNLYTNTNTWSIFEGMPMKTQTVFQAEHYFGTEDGRVCKGFTGFFDDVKLNEITGNGINGVIQPGYSYFGQPGTYKMWTMCRPTFLSTDQPGVTVQFSTDFSPPPDVGSPVFSQSSGALWDVSKWDESQWSGEYLVFSRWYQLNALGYSGSAVLKTSCVGDTFLATMDFMMEIGGPI